MTTWDILIASLTHRTDMLIELLMALGPQVEDCPGAGVRVYRDNREHTYTTKCQTLLESSTADYVSWIDDDDTVPDDFVQTIMAALESKPDQVGFRVLYTEDGQPQLPVVHSLEAGGWVDRSDGLYRDITQFNPMRRELALRAPWTEDGLVTDRMRAEVLRKQGCVKHEVFIDREMYHYQHLSQEGFTVTSAWKPMADPPPQPLFEFVTWL